MALSEALTNDTPSSEFTPTNGVCDVAVAGDFTGEVVLELLAPGFDSTDDWVPVQTFPGKGSQPVNTPDFALVYRFRGVNLEGTANVYMGP